jgi:hypothetical protein
MKDIRLFGLLLFFLFSYLRDKKKEKITRLVNEWQGKEIVFPEKPVFTRYLTNTTDYRILESEYDVAVTCGCAVVSYDKLSATAGKSLEVRVNMPSKDSGFFSETITVKTNTDQSIKLIIRRDAL